MVFARRQRQEICTRFLVTCLCSMCCTKACYVCNVMTLDKHRLHMQLLLLCLLAQAGQLDRSSGAVPHASNALAVRYLIDHFAGC